MSGSFFDYNEHHILSIKEELESIVANNGKERTIEELVDIMWYPFGPSSIERFIKEYPEEKYHPTYSEEEIKEFKEAIELLDKSYSLVKKIALKLSGD